MSVQMYKKPSAEHICSVFFIEIVPNCLLIYYTNILWKKTPFLKKSEKILSG